MKIDPFRIEIKKIERHEGDKDKDALTCIWLGNAYKQCMFSTFQVEFTKDWAVGDEFEGDIQVIDTPEFTMKDKKGKPVKMTNRGVHCFPGENKIDAAKRQGIKFKAPAMVAKEESVEADALA
jgi:hypothetical protein